MSWFFSGSDLTTEVQLWRNTAIAAGGTFEANSVQIANDFMEALALETFDSKIVYLLPLLGSNLATALVPLRNAKSFPAITNINFVDGDFSQTTGLKGNGSSKILDLNFTQLDIGPTLSQNAGMGYWETDMDYTGTSGQNPLGCTNNATSLYFQLQFGAGVQGFYCSEAANGAFTLTAASDGHYYGQRSSSTDRKLYKNAVQLASNTTGSTLASMGERDIFLMGVNNASAGTLYWKGRCACAYFTDGSLTPTEITDFDQFLRDYLFTPTGRPTT